MMRMKKGLPPQIKDVRGGGGVGRVEGGEKEWELRPGGMLVQKRTDSDQNRPPPPPPIRVRVKYGSIYHEMYISSQSSFGELKKMLSGPTGLHHQDQKLFYKDKERDSKMFLDSAGVKNKSKIVLVEDAVSQEKRYLETRKAAKIEKSAKSISDISLEVDRLAAKVSALESIVSKGGKVVEKDVVDLIELLMNQLLKLDGIFADGDVKLQRKIQVERVQKYVEILDVLKVKNSRVSTPASDVALQQLPTPAKQQHQPQPKHASSPFQPVRNSNGSVLSPVQHLQKHGQPSIDSPRQMQNPALLNGHSTSGAAVVITTQWETFDSVPAPVPSPHPSISAPPSKTTHPSFTWNLL